MAYGEPRECLWDLLYGFQIESSEASARRSGHNNPGWRGQAAE